MTSHYNVLVVGGGGAGCILARRLAERCPTASVALLEAGGDGRRSPFQDPDLTSVFQTWAPESNWQLQTVPQTGLEERRIPLTQGKVLGGGTSVNAMMYVRGDSAVLEEWQQLSGGHPAWSPARYLAMYRALECCLGDGFDPAIRGDAGPIQIRHTPNPSLSSLAFLDAAVQCGFQRDDFNGLQQLDVAGLMQLNLEADGLRCSMARAFLHEPLPANLSLHCGAEVRTLLLEGERLVGVRLLDNRVLQADQVVVAAGAFLTPALLMASGIGDPDLLAKASIPCHVENRHVGKNLSDHMRAMVAYRSPADPGRPEFLCESALFSRSGLQPGREPDIQINFSAGVDGFIPPEFLPTPAPAHTVIFVPVLVRPQSKGSVFPLGPRLEDGFGIDPAYLTHPTDLDVYVKAVEVVRQLAASSAMAPYCAEELCPGALEPGSYLRRYAQTIWHPVGSCAMGGDAATSACTPEFRLRGVSNGFVVDASVLPTLPSGNPQAAIFAMAAIAADTIGDALNA